MTSDVKTGQKEIFQGDGGLDTFFSRLQEKFYVFCTPKELGYLMETIEVKNDLRRGVRNVQNCQNVILTLKTIIQEILSVMDSFGVRVLNGNNWSQR